MFSHASYRSKILSFLPSERDRSAFLSFVRLPRLNGLVTREEIQKFSNFWKYRKKGEKRCKTEIRIIPWPQSNHHKREARSPVRMEKSESVGFIVQVMVPYPYRVGLGSDLTVVQWINLYLKQARKCFDSVNRSVRLLVGLNIFDDPNNCETSSSKLIDAVVAEAITLNKMIHIKGWPACVVPMIWGFSDGTSDALCSIADRVRSYSPWENQNTPFQCSFPFGKGRAALMESDESKRMLADLMHYNKMVYIQYSDADIARIEEMLNGFKKDISGSSIGISRVSCGYRYDRSEINKFLSSCIPQLSPFEKKRSMLLTVLLRALDNEFRRLTYASFPDNVLFYPAEPASAIRYDGYDSPEFFPDWNEFIRLIRTNRYADVSPVFTRVSRGYCKDKKELTVYPGEHYLPIFLVISSRHDLVVSKYVEFKDSLKGLFVRSESPDELWSVFHNQHNHQIRRSQVNSRWKDAGMGDGNFETFMDQLSDDYCFFKFFFLRRSNRRGAKRARTELDGVIQDARNRVLEYVVEQPLQLTWENVENKIKKFRVNDAEIDLEVVCDSAADFGIIAGKIYTQLMRWVTASERLLQWGYGVFYWLMVQKDAQLLQEPDVSSNYPIKAEAVKSESIERQEDIMSFSESRGPRVPFI